jgi:hypothetical protein
MNTRIHGGGHDVPDIFLKTILVTAIPFGIYDLVEAMEAFQKGRGADCCSYTGRALARGPRFAARGSSASGNRSTRPGGPAGLSRSHSPHTAKQVVTPVVADRP